MCKKHKEEVIESDDGADVGNVSDDALLAQIGKPFGRERWS